MWTTGVPSAGMRLLGLTIAAVLLLATPAGALDSRDRAPSLRTGRAIVQRFISHGMDASIIECSRAMQRVKCTVRWKLVVDDLPQTSIVTVAAWLRGHRRFVAFVDSVTVSPGIDPASLWTTDYPVMTP